MNFTNCHKERLMEAITFALSNDYSDDNSYEINFLNGASASFESSDNVNINFAYSAKNGKCVSLTIDETMSPESILDEIIERIGG